MDNLKPHRHVIHPNEILKKDLQGVNKLNDWLAVKITKSVGTMWCAYLFIVLDLLELGPVIRANNMITWVTYVSQTVLQLVLLPIIMVGQQVIQDQNNAKAEVDHKTLTYLANLQDKQMEELANQTKILKFLMKVDDGKESVKSK